MNKVLNKKVVKKTESFRKAKKPQTDKCILIFEDDPEILMLCTMLLKKADYHVESFMICDNVINETLRIKPDLVLMDLWIPEMGGEKAVTLLKEHPETKHVPVLLFSANERIEEICENVNADGYISKPFNVVAFQKIIADTI